MPTWAEALRRFIGQADEMGILVMCSGIVQNNTRGTWTRKSFAALLSPMTWPP